MAEMTNVSDVQLNVKISMGPGTRPMITTMEPGDTAQFPDGYCETVKGPGVERLPCVLSRSYSHLGVPALVPVAEAKEARARYERVRDNSPVNDPQAQIRRLEAELAAERAAKRVVEPDMVEATTPNVKAKPKGKNKGKN